MKFQFDIQDAAVFVELEKEGQARYMVRMKKGAGNQAAFRIGYLMGAKKTWVAEAGRARQAFRAASAKEACLYLAQHALRSPALA